MAPTWDRRLTRGWPIKDRFMHYVELIPESTCWYWTGAIGPGGYGRFTVAQGLVAIAHRFAYELLMGPIPAGLTLDHLCREKSCINPRHLEPVTADENIKRSSECVATINSRKTHCPRGHEYTPENTRISRGKRYCEACRPFWRPNKNG